MSECIHWGFIGCGAIARGFATGLGNLPEARITMVAARDQERAQTFANQFAINGQQPRAVDDYQAVMHDPEVDVVYIATTAHNHVALARAAIACGKAVLVEKPVGLHAAEVEIMIAEARKAGVFLMEAMWMRFIPAFVQLQEQLRQGIIGRPSLIQADFNIALDMDAGHRLLDPQLGGGGLWDLGIYPLTFARVLFGDDPEDWATQMIPAPETGVDQFVAIQARYPHGRIAQLSCGFRMATPHQGRIYGSEGRIVVDDFFHPQGYQIIPKQGDAQSIQCPFTSTGYQFEAAEVHRCLRAGLSESPHCPLDETLAIIRCMDAMVTGWGVNYPASH